jgi:hypothetical protein
MDLIVEDGSVVEGANSYATVEEADAYFSARGRADWAALPVERRKQLMIIAADYLNIIYVWAGTAFYTVQTMALPTSLVDYVPTSVKSAQFLLAYEAKDGELTKPIEGPSIKSEEKKLDGVGGKKIEYQNNSPLAGRSFPLIDALVGRFTTSGTTSGIQSARRLRG